MKFFSNLLLKWYFFPKFT